MKNVLIVWNVILTGLVVYLFTVKTETQEPEINANDSTQAVTEAALTGIVTGNVYYLNTDSLFNGLDMYKDMQEELVAEQLRLKKRYDNQLGKLET